MAGEPSAVAMEGHVGFAVACAGHMSSIPIAGRSLSRLGKAARRRRQPSAATPCNCNQSNHQAPAPAGGTRHPSCLGRVRARFGSAAACCRAAHAGGSVWVIGSAPAHGCRAAHGRQTHRIERVKTSDLQSMSQETVPNLPEL